MHANMALQLHAIIVDVLQSKVKSVTSFKNSVHPNTAISFLFAE